MFHNLFSVITFLLLTAKHAKKRKKNLCFFGASAVYYLKQEICLRFFLNILSLFKSKTIPEYTLHQSVTQRL